MAPTSTRRKIVSSVVALVVGASLAACDWLAGDDPGSGAVASQGDGAASPTPAADAASPPTDASAPPAEASESGGDVTDADLDGSLDGGDSSG